jgi:hypothetical protein
VERCDSALLSAATTVSVCTSSRPFSEIADFVTGLAGSEKTLFVPQ